MSDQLLTLIYVLIAIIGAFISKAFFREVKPEIPEELHTLNRILLKLGYFDFIAWGVIGAWMLHFLQSNYFPLLFLFKPLNLTASFFVFIFGFFASTVFGRFWQFYSAPNRLVNKLEIISFKCFPTEPMIDRGSGEPTYADLKIKLRQTGHFWVPGGVYGVKVIQDSKKMIGIMAGNNSLDHNHEIEITVPWKLEGCGKENWQTTLTAYVIGNPNTEPVASAVAPKNITVKIQETEDPLSLMDVKDIKFLDGDTPLDKITVGKEVTVSMIVSIDQDYFNLSEEARSEVFIVLYLDSNPLKYFKFIPTQGESLYNIDYTWIPEEERLYSFGAAAHYGNARTDMIVRGVYVEKMEAVVQLKSIEMEPQVTKDKPVMAGEVIHFYATLKNQSPKALKNGQFRVFFRFDGPKKFALDYDGPTSLDKDEERKFGPVVWSSQAGSDWVVKADASSTDTDIDYPSDEKRTKRFRILSDERPVPKITSRTVVIKSEEIELSAEGTEYTEGKEWKWEHIWTIGGKEYKGEVVKHRVMEEGIIAARLTVRGTFGDYTVEASESKTIYSFVPPVIVKTDPSDIASAKQDVSFEAKIDQDYLDGLKKKLEELKMDFDLAEFVNLESKIFSCKWTLGPNKSSKTGKKISFKMPDEKLWFNCAAEVSFKNTTDKVRIETGLEVTKPVAIIAYERDTETIGKIKFSASESSDASGAKIDKYSWDFGDGKTGSGETVEHRFTGSKRFYTIKLTVKNQYAAEGKDEEEVEVELPLKFEVSKVGAIVGVAGQLVNNVDWKGEYRMYLEIENKGATPIDNIGCSLIEVDDLGNKREILFEPSDDTVKNKEKTFLISETLYKDWSWCSKGLYFSFDISNNKKQRKFTYIIKVWGETDRQRKEYTQISAINVKVPSYRVKAAEEANTVLRLAIVREVARSVLSIATAAAGAVPGPQSIAIAAGLAAAEEVERHLYMVAMEGASSLMNQAKD